MSYRILTVTSHRDNYESLYQYMTTTIDGETIPLELATKEALDTKVEKMLNEDGYSKKDFIVVQVIDYTIDAKDYSDDEAEPEPELEQETGFDTGADDGEGDI